jgi:oleandomycin transport system permease protein
MTTIAQPASLPETIPQERVGPLDAVRHTLTLAWRSLVQIRHNPMELTDLSLQPLMFVVLFAYVFGGAIAGSPKAYLQFGLAGIICQNALFLTMNTGMALHTDITKGVFDRFRSLPIARSAPLAGRIVADVVRQVWSMAILIAVGLLLGFRIQTDLVGVLGAVALLVVFTLGFSWLPVLVAMLVDEPEKVMMLGFVVVFPLTFASSAFVPTGTMPGWLRAFAAHQPVTLIVNAARALLLGQPLGTTGWQALAWCIGILAVFAPVSVWLYRTRTAR